MNAVRPGLVVISSNLAYQGSQAAATGMEISSDGLVLTNNHVITGTTLLRATVVSTNRSYTAKWLGYDAADDPAGIPVGDRHNPKNRPRRQPHTGQLGEQLNALGKAPRPAPAPPEGRPHTAP